MGCIHKLAGGDKVEPAAADGRPLQRAYASKTMTIPAVRPGQVIKSLTPTFKVFGYIGALPFLTSCLRVISSKKVKPL